MKMLNTNILPITDMKKKASTFECPVLLVLHRGSF